MAKGWRIFIGALQVLGALVLLLPVLLLAMCSYTWFSPHLRLDAINRALMDAPADPEHSWRTVDVALLPDLLQPGMSQASATARLGAAGFRLWADYSTEIGPRDPYPDDDMPQAQLDQMFAADRQQYNAVGITHVFEQSGRLRVACGESLFVEAGFTQGILSHATGYSRWSCL